MVLSSSVCGSRNDLGTARVQHSARDERYSREDFAPLDGSCDHGLRGGSISSCLVPSSSGSSAELVGQSPQVLPDEIRCMASLSNTQGEILYMVGSLGILYCKQLLR